MKVSNLHFLLFFLHTCCKMAKGNYTRKDQWENRGKASGEGREGTDLVTDLVTVRRLKKTEKYVLIVAWD